MTVRELIWLPLIFTLGFASGCEDELNFSTGEMEVFSGEIIDADFIREQPQRDEELLATGTTMELRLNMRSLDSEPGMVTTSDGMFDDVSLVMLPEITCDRLSGLEIPGNYMRSFLFLAPTSSQELQGADAVLFVSLGQSENVVDVRVLAGAGEGRRAFGVFHLIRETVEEETE